MTEREYPIACSAWEEVNAAVKRFSSSADTTGLAELGRLRAALAVALADYDPNAGGLRWRWCRLRRRNHTLTAVLTRYGVEPDLRWTPRRSPADP